MLADEAVIGHVRFIGNQPAESRFILILGNDTPPRPNTFTDPAKWPDKWPPTEDGKTRPKDPWSQPQTKTPLKLTSGPLTGRVVIYEGRDEISRHAIGLVHDAFAEKRRRPLVTLGSVKREDKKGLIVPHFEIVRFTEDDEKVPGLHLARTNLIVAADEPKATNGADKAEPAFGAALEDDPSAANGGPPHKYAGELDDDIPF